MAQIQGPSAAQGIVAGGTGTMAEAFFVPWEETFIKAWFAQVSTDGVSSRSLPLKLHRNALVRRYDITLTAAGAEAVLLKDAAKLRRQEGATSGTVDLVADFGALFTVASVGVLSAFSPVRITAVYAWTGVGFSPQPLPLTGLSGVEFPPAVMVANFNEVRTERLRIIMTGVGSRTVEDELWVALPDPPSDLELRIDGGAPVWRFPGPVRAGTGGWTADAKQTVDISAALAALAGDPDHDDEATFTLSLTSRTPGRLDLAVGAKELRYLTRPTSGDPAPVEFDIEGRRTVPLALPSWVQTVERIGMTVAGALPPERADPPVGPPVATRLGTGGVVPDGVAELVLDVDRSAAVRLPAGAGLLEELVAIRLPLRAEAGGAEARVVLLAAREDTSEPGEPMEGGASKAATWEEGDEYGWTTFEFAKPVKLDPAVPLPWAALAVGRGRVAWPLAVASAPAADANAAVRRGPPAGPWQRLPALVTHDTAVGGALRVIGHAGRDHPLAPVTVEVAGATGSVPVTPTAKPVAVEWPPAPQVGAVHPAAGVVSLVVTSRVGGALTLADVIVTATR